MKKLTAVCLALLALALSMGGMASIWTAVNIPIVNVYELKNGHFEVVGTAPTWPVMSLLTVIYLGLAVGDVIWLMSETRVFERFSVKRSEASQYGEWETHKA